MARLLKLRKSQIDNLYYRKAWADDAGLLDRYEEGTLVGMQVYVIECVKMVGAVGYRHNRNNLTYWLRTRIPITNRRVEREQGWLGTTDNVDRYSLGRYEIVGESSTHLHLHPVPVESEG